MRPFTHTIPFAEALSRTLGAVRPVDRAEDVSLQDASGRVLAEDVVADTDVPPFDRAAMDGYAVRAGDTAGATQAAPRVLRCIERIYTGSWPGHELQPGECAEIATGAPMPAGADAVVMVEQTSPHGDSGIAVHSPARQLQHVSRRGADVAGGETLVAAGEILTPSRLGACAAAGRVSVHVYARPSVAIVSTGSELRQPGQPLAPGQIYDINRFTLSAIVAAHGGIARVFPAVGDDEQALHAVLRPAAGAADLIVFSGGSSVGEKDVVLDAIRREGVVLFHGIAVKPGKPTAAATMGRALILAMPGNPASCLSNGYMLLVPVLRKLARLPAHEPRAIVLPLARRIASTADRHQFYTVRIEGGAVVPAFKASGDITSMSRADGYIEVPAGVEAVEAGERVEVKLF